MPGIADKAEAKACGSSIAAEPAVENDIVLIGPIDGIARHSQADARPQLLDAIRNETGRERQHLDWKRRRGRAWSPACRRRRSTIIRVAAAATIFSRSMAPPFPLIARNCGSSSSAPSMARSSFASVSKGSTVQAGRFRGAAGGERRCDGRHLEARRDPFPERGDGEVRRRAGAKADQHPVLDLGDGGASRRAFARRDIVLSRWARCHVGCSILRN